MCIRDRVTPYDIVMYGYNAVIKVQDASNLSKAFYGPSAGIGIDLKPHARSKVYYSFGLTIPFRGSEVDDYIEDLKNNHGVVFENDLIPVTFSIGFKSVSYTHLDVYKRQGKHHTVFQVHEIITYWSANNNGSAGCQVRLNVNYIDLYLSLINL